MDNFSNYQAPGSSYQQTHTFHRQGDQVDSGHHHDQHFFDDEMGNMQDTGMAFLDEIAMEDFSTMDPSLIMSNQNSVMGHFSATEVPQGYQGNLNDSDTGTQTYAPAPMTLYDGRYHSSGDATTALPSSVTDPTLAVEAGENTLEQLFGLQLNNNGCALCQGTFDSHLPGCAWTLLQDCPNQEVDYQPAPEPPEAQTNMGQVAKRSRSMPRGYSEFPSNVRQDASERPPEYERRFANFQAAREALTPSVNMEPTIRLDLENDDWQNLNGNQLHQCARQIFISLTENPGPALTSYTAEQTMYHEKHQAIQLNSIKEEIKHSPPRAEARCMLMLELILQVHANGIPESVMSRTNFRQGFVPERNWIFSVRLEKIIEAVQRDKYTAQDVLSGAKGLVDFARSPERYLRRKAENCRVNAKKALDKKIAEENRKVLDAGTGLKRRMGQHDGQPSAKRWQG